jgi:hypothetical protein
MKSEWTGRGDPAGSGGARRHHLRSGDDDWWRSTQRGANAVRISSRSPRGSLSNRRLLVLPESRAGRPRADLSRVSSAHCPPVRPWVRGGAPSVGGGNGRGLWSQTRGEPAGAVAAGRGCGTSHPRSIGAPGGQRPPPAVARFASHAIRSATGFTCCHVHSDEARSLFGGNAAQSLLAFDAPLTAGFGLILTDLGNAIGWLITLGNKRELVRNLILLAASSTVTSRVLAPYSG